MKYVVTPEAVWPASKMQNHNIVAYMNSSYQMHRASAIDFVVFVLFSKRKKIVLQCGKNRSLKL